jgi:transposase
MGRPTKLTPEVKETIFKAIREGNTLQVACMKAGIVYDTMRGWLEQAEKGGAYSVFSVELARAREEAEEVLVGEIKKAARQDWRAAAWMLERRFPDRWGKVEMFKGDMQHSGKVTIVFEEVGDERPKDKREADRDVLKVPDPQS